MVLPNLQTMEPVIKISPSKEFEQFSKEETNPANCKIETIIPFKNALIGQSENFASTESILQEANPQEKSKTQGKRVSFNEQVMVIEVTNWKEYNKLNSIEPAEETPLLYRCGIF